MQIPKSALYIGYKLIFGTKYQGDRLNLLKGIPKRHVLYEIAGLNHRLRAAIEKEFKSDFQEQFDELKYFCGQDDRVAYPYFKRIHPIKLELDKRRDGGHVVLFNRPANLFAFQEILERKLDDDNETFVWGHPYWENMLKYYLCVNDLVSEYDAQDSDQKHTQFEKLASGSFFLNELTVVNDPFQTMNRFVRLYQYLDSDKELGTPLKKYFENVGTGADEFLSCIFSSCFLNKNENMLLRFHYYMDPNNEDLAKPIQVFKYLSRRGLVKKEHDLDVADLRKSPIYADAGDHYIIVDNLFVTEKLYELFINDLWFETVKPTGMDIRAYKSKIGYFLEEHVCNLFRLGLKKFKFPSIRCLDELKTKIGDNQVELADFYFRHNTKVLVGQIKSTGIYSNQQYGTAQSLFRNSEDSFYDTFGLYQLITSIKYLRDHPNEFDKDFPDGKNIRIFPMLVVNEKIFQTALIPAMFQIKFEELIKKEQFKHFDIKPLAIVHVDDVERICFHLETDKEDLWDLLKANYTGSIFPKPFRITLNRRKMNPDYEKAKREISTFTGIK